MVEGRHVVYHLSHVGHAAEHDLDARDVLQPAEGEGSGAGAGPQGLQALLRSLARMRELAAAHRFHHDDGQAPAVQDLHLAAGVLQGPVEVVELDLHELDDFAVGAVQDFLQVVRRGVAGEAEVLDPAFLALPREILQDTPAGIHVVVEAVLADVVVEIEVEIIHAALLELAPEGAGGVEGAAVLVARELVGEHPGLAGIARKGLADDGLGVAVMVGKGRVEVVDAVADGVVDHLRDGVTVDALVGERREAHRPEAQCGYLLV